MLSKQELQAAVPERLKINVTQDLADKLNNISADPLHAENIRENFLTYTRVLQDGKYKIEDYMNAVAYVSYKLMGYNNQDSYFKTFPDRQAALVAKGASRKDISAYVAAYNKNKLVNSILEQSLIPIHILNQDAVQKAINTQMEIMSDDTLSPIARTQAANSILTHLVKKEVAQVQLNIETSETSALKDLQQAMAELAKQQKELIANGASAKSIAESSIVEGEYTHVE